MEEKMIAIKIMGFDSNGEVNKTLITIPSDRFGQLTKNTLFYEFMSRKIMDTIYEEAKRLEKDKYLTIEEVLDKLGYNECLCDEDKICIDKNKLKEYIDRK